MSVLKILPGRRINCKQTGGHFTPITLRITGFNSDIVRGSERGQRMEFSEFTGFFSLPFTLEFLFLVLSQN